MFNSTHITEPPSISLLSCTSKAATPPRRALIHQQTTKLPQTTQKSQKRRAQCHQQELLEESTSPSENLFGWRLEAG